MLTDRDFIITCATILTGLLLVFTFFDYSLDNKITYLDKQYELEQTQKEFIELSQNFTFFKFINDPYEYESYEAYLTDPFVRHHMYKKDIEKLELKIDELRDDKIKKEILLHQPVRNMSIVFFGLFSTVICATVHSLLPNVKTTKYNVDVLSITTHMLFILTWGFIINLTYSLFDIMI